LVWYGNRSTPLTGESERVLEQRGHCTKAMPLSSHRLRSMATLSEENGHLGDVLVCPCSCAVSTLTRRLLPIGIKEHHPAYPRWTPRRVMRRFGWSVLLHKNLARFEKSRSDF